MKEFDKEIVIGLLVVLLWIGLLACTPKQEPNPNKMDTIVKGLSTIAK